MTWGGAGDMVVSGGICGEKELGRPSGDTRYAHRAGHIVTYNFNGIHRDMNRGEYRLMWKW